MARLPPRCPPASSTSGTGFSRLATAVRTPRQQLLAFAGLVAVIGAVPLAVALVALREPRWYPVLDWAQTELRVRDVGTSHTPLLGLPGRLDALGEVGSHPGPVSFYVLAPLYRLTGSSSWGLMVATAVLQVLAIGAAVWLAHRRGGPGLALGAVALLGILVHAYGAERLAVPWNPWLPMLWWFLFLLAAWSVLCDDLPVLPLLAAAGTFCVQTHISYVGLVGGLGGLVVAVLVMRAWRSRRDPLAARRLLRWSLVAGVVGAVLWAPPVAQELTNDPGNLTILRARFSDPVEEAVGLVDGLGAWLAHLDVGALLSGRQRLDGAPLWGLLLLAVWAGSVAVAWRLRDRRLVALHAVVAAGLVLGLLSITRVLGRLWDYLVLWSWGTTALVLLAVGWTTWVLVRGRRGTRDFDRSRLRRPALVATAVVAVVAAVASTAEAGRAEPPFPGVSRTLGRVVPPLVRALESGTLPGGGAGGRYLVTWDDSFSAGLAAYSLVLELERSGIEAGLTPDFEVTVAGSHRVLRREVATAFVAYVSGQDAILRWRAMPDAVEVVHAEPPTIEAVRLARLRGEVSAALVAANRADLLPLLDTNVFGLSVDPRLPEHLVDDLRDMRELSAPRRSSSLPWSEPEAAALTAWRCNRRPASRAR